MVWTFWRWRGFWLGLAALVIIAVQAVFLYALYRANSGLRADLAAQKAETEKVQTAYDAYRLAADKMMLQMEETHQRHHKTMRGLSDAMRADPLWAKDKLPPLVREVLEQ